VRVEQPRNSVRQLVGEGFKGGTTKEKPDILTAASRNINNMSDGVTWLFHPHSNEYSYTTSTQLATGYPVRNNMTHKVEMVISEESTSALTIHDAMFAQSMGLEVDYGQVPRCSRRSCSASASLARQTRTPGYPSLGASGRQAGARRQRRAGRGRRAPVQPMLEGALLGVLQVAPLRQQLGVHLGEQGRR